MFNVQWSMFNVLSAQTLNVRVGSVIYQFPAAQTGEMTYADGSTVTIMGKTFTLADIDAMTVDDSEVKDNTVNVDYNGTTADITIAGNVAQYVEATVSGAHVSMTQTNTDAVDGDEITYVLSGSTTDGSLTLDGLYKCTVSLEGLTMTNPGGAAINITNKKRIQISAKNGTENTLTDGSNGSQKACIYSKGQLQLQGKGTLNVAGNTKHAIKSGDYISVKNLTLNITKAVGDGISCEEYFQMKSGSVTISGVGDDGNHRPRGRGQWKRLSGGWHAEYHRDGCGCQGRQGRWRHEDQRRRHHREDHRWRCVGQRRHENQGIELP